MIVDVLEVRKSDALAVGNWDWITVSERCVYGLTRFLFGYNIGGSGRFVDPLSLV